MTWISIKDRMPKNDYNWVLITELKKGTGEPCPIWFGRMTALGWELYEDAKYPDDEVNTPDFSDLWSDIHKDNITHWMPLPERPKDDA